MSSWLDTNMNSYVNFGADLGAIFNAIKNPTNPLFVALGAMGFAANLTTSRIGKGKIMSMGISLAATVAATVFFYFAVKTNWFHPIHHAPVVNKADQPSPAAAFTPDQISDPASFVQNVNADLQGQTSAISAMVNKALGDKTDAKSIANALNSVSSGNDFTTMPGVREEADLLLSNATDEQKQRYAGVIGQYTNHTLTKADIPKFNEMIFRLKYPSLSPQLSSALPKNDGNKTARLLPGAIGGGARSGGASSVSGTMAAQGPGASMDQAQLALVAAQKPYEAFSAENPSDYTNPAAVLQPHNVSYQRINQ